MLSTLPNVSLEKIVVSVSSSLSFFEKSSIGVATYLARIPFGSGFISLPQGPAETGPSGRETLRYWNPDDFQDKPDQESNANGEHRGVLDHAYLASA